MRDELLYPLQAIIAATEALLQATELEDLLRRFIESIHLSATQIRDSIISIPDLTWDNAREVLSYELRTSLSAIIGYAEMLLDEEYGPLDSVQAQLVNEIQLYGKQMLATFMRLWG